MDSVSLRGRQYRWADRAHGRMPLSPTSALSGSRPISREIRIVRRDTIAAPMLSPKTTAPVRRGVTISSWRDRRNRFQQGVTMSDTARPVSDVMHRIWISALLFGALAAILGVAMLVWPGPSIVVAAALFGAYLVLSGVAMVVLAFALPAASGAGRVLYFLSGAISVILGILAFRHFGEGYAILLLAIWIVVGIWLIILGVTEVISAFGMRSDVKKVDSMADTAGRPAFA